MSPAKIAFGAFGMWLIMNGRCAMYKNMLLQKEKELYNLMNIHNATLKSLSQLANRSKVEQIAFRCPEDEDEVESYEFEKSPAEVMTFFGISTGIIALLKVIQSKLQ